METIIISVANQQDAVMLRQLSYDKGWKMLTSELLLQQLVETAPANVPLTDEDIMNEVREVRRSNAYAVA